LNLPRSGLTIGLVHLATPIGPLARVAAALLVVALSGLPRLAAQFAPADCHVCRCKAHEPGHECPCALCRKAALEARATNEKSPPCHRAAARVELARSKRGPCDPVVDGNCGGTGHTPFVLGGVEPFLVSSVGSLGVILYSERILISPGCARELSRRPPTPPPRTA
jgi:hypothetical protein